MKRLFLEIKKNGATYEGLCWETERSDGHKIENLRLGPNDVVTIPDAVPPYADQKYLLGDLVKALIGFDAKDLQLAFEERGQINLGRHLYEHTIGQLSRYEHEAQLDLRIIAHDEHLGLLPWPLLSRNGIYLVQEGWAISLCTRPNTLDNLELPPRPKILMVAPEPKSASATNRDQHITTLQLLLRQADPGMAAPGQFKVVFTWEKFKDAVEQEPFDIIYYWGHGLGNQVRNRLVFESSADGNSKEKAIVDFADVLRNGKGSPTLVYLNCCQGDAGGLLGAGRQISAFTPCVVTNRTVALVKTASEQALAFWKDVLIRGVEPQTAVARNYQQTGKLNLERTKPHWFTPVVYTNYGPWKSNPPHRVQTKNYDPHWQLKLDRVNQFGRLTLKVRDMLREKKPRSLAFIWYGEEGQGMGHFHERLEVELQNHIEEADVVSYRPRWPEYFSGKGQRRFSSRALEEMLLQAFNVDAVGQIGARVRRDTFGRSALVVVNHPHTRSSNELDLRMLKGYLEWWDNHIHRLLDEDTHFFLLGFSFLVEDWKTFETNLSKNGYDTLDFSSMAVDALEPLESIKRKDLIDFFKRHNVYIPRGRKDQYLDYIMDRTKGEYEATLIELEKLIIEGYEEIVDKDEGLHLSNH